ncbi:HAD family hydrolase [Occultella aeris]|uniref:Haloacid dehalogenase-like hydrolase n=1 Tax=Occultella aeris TaxID=2761496 RepID=A0A7M4DKY0_9MICO|nr:HAD hydrolase family protein [Occultella aeris]VZO37865.1 haloacid dehalogenase-like hydrolase [Occultella aeris]
MRTIVSDLDGTIAFGGRRPARSIRSALFALAAAPDTRVVLATSRTPRCVGDWFGPRAHRFDLVCCNGALVVRRSGTAPARGSGAHAAPTAAVTRTAIPATAVGHIVATLGAAGAAYCLEYGHEFVATDHDSLPWWGARHRRVLAPGRVPDLVGVVKVTVAHSQGWARTFEALEGVDVFPHETGDMDVVASGVDKAAALAGLLDGARTAVLAFGNDRNDLALLRAADRAVVVGTGLAELDELPTVRRVAASPDAVLTALRAGVRQLMDVVPAGRAVASTAMAPPAAAMPPVSAASR